MGIIGLTTFIANHSSFFLEDYMLRDTYLVIDGNCIACQLYIQNTHSNCAFGGDYDKYARCVSEFFGELLKCNVTPLVIIDGGCEDKKLNTIVARTKEKIERASYYGPASQRTNKFLPLLLTEVFMDVMMQKGIRYGQCLFEADNTIAAIARILNCPVLSYDSDFYVYGSLYIPFNTWKDFTFRNPSSSGSSHVKHCRIYRVERLFKFYNGLNQSLLPLAAVLLGNDYIKSQNVFRNFFRHLKLPATGRRRFSDQQRRIDAVFNWLRKHSLNQAIISILSRSQKQVRKRVLNIIETILNSYFSASLDVLHLLNIPAEHCSKREIENASRTYKFEGDIYNLTYIEETSNEVELDDDDEEVGDGEIAGTLQEKKMISNESLVDTLPQWFTDEFKLCRYPSYFMDVVIRKLYICPIQIEDYSCPTPITASLNIVSVIYALLVSDMKEKKTCLEYMIRDKNKGIKRFELEYSDTVSDCRLPSLSNLRELPGETRRKIMNATLGIDCENRLKEIPSNWTLYIAIMKYWVDQQKEPSELSCHVYSLLFAMLFTIIDHKIGTHRYQNKFHSRFDKIIEDIRCIRRIKDHDPLYSDEATLKVAFCDIDDRDCLIAASYFISHFEMDQRLCTQSKRMDVTIVHRFAEFQYCLRHATHLNSLLDYPYERMKIATLFNGTLLYNLCSNFKKRDNVEAYINTVLKDSPSLLHLFNKLLSTAKSLFGVALEKKASKVVDKHRTKKCNTKKRTAEEGIINENTLEHSEGNKETFYDVNNLFSVLSAT